MSDELTTLEPYTCGAEPLVLELYVKRYGLTTDNDVDVIRKIEQEIILAGLRLQQRNQSDRL